MLFKILGEILQLLDLRLVVFAFGVEVSDPIKRSLRFESTLPLQAEAFRDGVDPIMWTVAGFRAATSD